MADQTYTSSTLQGYVNLDLVKAASREDKSGVAGNMTDTLRQLAEFDRRVATLEDIARKLIGG